MFDNVVIPDTLNELLIVDALETNILEKLVLFNNDVDVACKFEIFKVEFVERLFKFAVVARSGLFIMLSYIKLVKPEPEPTTNHLYLMLII